MIIGNFMYSAKDDRYEGSIRTLSFDRPSVSLLPVRKVNDREPDYRVVDQAARGTVEFGAAWKRRSEKGQSFLSVMLDDPALGQPLSLALFDDRDGKATLVWTRPRAKASDPEPDAPTSKAHRAPSARAARLG